MRADVGSKRLAVLLVGLVGVISIVTGIANIAYGSVAVFGPLAPYVPPLVTAAAGFTGTITGFLMLMAAFALRGGYRAGWYLGVVLLPVTAAQGLFQVSTFSMPLVVLSVLSMPTLLISHDRFREPVTLSATQIAAGLALVGVQLYGTVGAYALRDEFGALDTPLDAFYFTLVTASTVGYGDVTPQTQVARLFAMTVLVFGTASFAVALGALLGPLIEARFAAAVGRVRPSELEMLEDHVLVLGSGDLTEPIVEELTGRREFVVVSHESEPIAELADRDVVAIQADPSDEAVLDRVKVDEAAVVIAATENDATDAFSVLTARQCNPDLRIVAAATNAENESKLERAGADVVISPATVGGRLLVQTAAVSGGETASSADAEEQGE